MNIEQEIRAQIEKNRGLKLAVGEINNHLSVLEGLLRNERDDAQKRVDDAYQKGLDDAWEAAKKLFSSMADSDIEKAFPIEWNNGGFKALMDLQPQEAINRIKAYEEQKADEEIKVGDEVDWSGDRFIVTRIYKLFVDKNHCDGIGKNGCVYNDVLVESLVKTGRTFPLVASIVEEMTK